MKPKISRQQKALNRKLQPHKNQDLKY